MLPAAVSVRGARGQHCPTSLYSRAWCFQEVVTELRDIASWLHDAQTTDEFISSYAGVRSNLILSALNALPDGSPGSFAVPGTPS